jgi:hypothetical protein
MSDDVLRPPGPTELDFMALLDAEIAKVIASRPHPTNPGTTFARDPELDPNQGERLLRRVTQRARVPGGHRAGLTLTLTLTLTLPLTLALTLPLVGARAQG